MDISADLSSLQTGEVIIISKYGLRVTNYGRITALDTTEEVHCPGQILRNDQIQCIQDVRCTLTPGVSKVRVMLHGCRGNNLAKGIDGNSPAAYGLERCSARIGTTKCSTEIFHAHYIYR